jgi:two-component system, OmpR family, response regulator
MTIHKILLVDDEPAFTRVIRNYLQESGRFYVRMENTSTKALATAREFKPDLILLDVIMPDMDGGEIAAQLRNDPRLNQTPIIFLTAAVSKEDVTRQGEVIGGNTFLPKPVDAEELIGAIDRKLRAAA